MMCTNKVTSGLCQKKSNKWIRVWHHIPIDTGLGAVIIIEKENKQCLISLCDDTSYPYFKCSCVFNSCVPNVLIDYDTTITLLHTTVLIDSDTTITLMYTVV